MEVACRPEQSRQRSARRMRAEDKRIGGVFVSLEIADKKIYTVNS
jgi:hypothetical protein